MLNTCNIPEKLHTPDWLGWLKQKGDGVEQGSPPQMPAGDKHRGGLAVGCWCQGNNVDQLETVFPKRQHETQLKPMVICRKAGPVISNC